MPYVADFETTTSPTDCRVWCWALVNIDDESDLVKGLTIDEFFAAIQGLNDHVYFHNLGFDGRFILDYMFKHGYVFSDFTDKPFHFTTLISNMGKFYSISVRFSKRSRVEFRDSLKKMPLPVSEIAKAFGLEMSKGEIDYNAPRPYGYEPTAEEWDYVERDVKIVAAALKQLFDAGAKALTAGADSFKEFKSVFGEKFKSAFPTFSQSMDAEMRRAYRGGFTYLNPKHAGKIINGEGMVYDVNSLYPYVMESCPLPYGEPVYVEVLEEAPPGYNLAIMSATFTCQLKPNHIPCIQIKNNPHFSPTQYLESITEPTELALTNIDWQLINEHYDVNLISFNGAWTFQSTTDFFTKFIDKWRTIKETSKGGKRYLAKLHLNSLYGKFGTNPDVTGKEPILVDDRVKFRMGPAEYRDPIYVPIAVFVTSYAREITIRAAQRHYDRFIYCDTDSLHLLGTSPPLLDIHESRFGAWKHESTFTRGLFIRAKQYLEDIDGECEAHIAGLPAKLAKSLTIDEACNGVVLHGKLVPQSVPGGVILQETTFNLKIGDT